MKLCIHCWDTVHTTSNLKAKQEYPHKVPLDKHILVDCGADGSGSGKGNGSGNGSGKGSVTASASASESELNLMRCR